MFRNGAKEAFGLEQVNRTMCNEKERKSTPYKKGQRVGLKKSKGKIVSGKRAKGAEHKSGKAWRIDWNGIAFRIGRWAS